MKNRYLIGLTLGFLALTGCAGASTLTYSVRTNIANPADSLAIFQASERVMTRRLAAADVKNAQVTVIPRGSGSAVMTLKVPDQAGVTQSSEYLPIPSPLMSAAKDRGPLTCFRMKQTGFQPA